MGRWVAWLLFGRAREDPVGTALPAPRPRPRGLLLYVLAASLTVAAIAGITAITSGSLGTDHLRVLGTSLGFAVFSATSAAGSAARRDGRGTAALLVGIITVVLSTISLISLVSVLWDLDGG